MFFGSKEYKVSIKGRSSVIYAEGQREARIETEMLTGPTDLVIYFEQFRSWQPPFQNDVLSERDRQRIKSNIAKELEASGLTLEWN